MTLKREIKDAYLEGGNSIYVKTHSNAVYVDDNETETLTQRLDNVKSKIDNNTSQLNDNTNEISAIKTNYAKKTEVNKLASDKADKTDLEATNTNVAKNTTELEAQKARMDTFTKLAEGSTTGDAELVDARVGADGVTYTNVGSAIREQFTDLKNNLDDIAIIESRVVGTFSYKSSDGFLLSNGKFSNGSNYTSTFCIFSVKAGDKLLYIGDGHSEAYSILFYDESGNILDDKVQINNVSSYTPVIVPDRAVRAIASSMAYKPNTPILDIKYFDSLTYNADNIRKDIYSLENDRACTLRAHIIGKNLFNPDFYENGYLDEVSGKVVTSSPYRSTGYYLIEKFTSGIALSGKLRKIVFYDKNKNVVQGIDLPDSNVSAQEKQVFAMTDLDSSIKYFRFTYYKSNKDIIQIEDNTVVTKYEKPDIVSDSVSDIVSDIAPGIVSDIVSEYCDIAAESYIETPLTDTYGFINISGKVSAKGNKRYNYTAIPLTKGTIVQIHSAQYKLIVPYVFITQTGEVFPYTTELNSEDATVYEKIVKFKAPSDGTLYVNYYGIPISVADISDYKKFSTIKLEKLDTRISDGISKSFYNGNILYGKKWAVCGDSFSNGDFTGAQDTDYYITDEGLYKGKFKTYGYLIGNRNNMIIQHLAFGGKTIATPADGSFHNAFSDLNSQTYNEKYFNYTNIDSDVDYITLYFGINDSHHRPSSTGSDGEDQRGIITIGTIDDTDNTTFYGAWNVTMEYLITNYPYAHIGILVSNGCETDEYRKATIAIARKWGIPYIDMNGDDRTPVMNRSTNTDILASVRNARSDAFKVSSTNGHPSAKAHEYESLFIENFLRSL